MLAVSESEWLVLRLTTFAADLSVLITSLIALYQAIRAAQAARKTLDGVEKRAHEIMEILPHLERHTRFMVGYFQRLEAEARRRRRGNDPDSKVQPEP